MGREVLMMETDPSTANEVRENEVLVAYDGSEEGLPAVEYAAREAARLGVALHVVHVVPGWAPVGPLTPGTTTALHAAGTEVLAQARGIAANVAPDMRVRTDLVEGARVPWILERVGSASLLVVGRRRGSGLDRIWRGGTLDGIASRAPCPVVIVPPDWSSARQGDVVLAAFKSPRHAGDVFAAAFARAETAWQLPGIYDDIVAGRADAQEWVDRQSQIVDESLVPWREAFPQVPVRVTITHDVASSALVRASEHALHLVLGRPAHGGWAHHLGRTARAVLRFAACPTEVVVPGAGWERPEVPWSLEEEGSLLR
jgi:nucleotide-binding universal stress UspA family protein